MDTKLSISVVFPKACEARLSAQYVKQGADAPNGFPIEAHGTSKGRARSSALLNLEVLQNTCMKYAGIDPIEWVDREFKVGEETKTFKVPTLIAECKNLGWTITATDYTKTGEDKGPKGYAIVRAIDELEF